MSEDSRMPLLVRQSHPDAPPAWDEMLVGYDFSLLAQEEIQGWARTQTCPGVACQALGALHGEGLLDFERALWTAITEATGKTPRPGSQRWAKAQDRWRVALLKDALEVAVSPEALAILVEGIYDAVGCPEDMVGLWRRPSGPGQRQSSADRSQIQDFIRRCEPAFSKYFPPASLSGNMLPLAPIV